MITYPISSKFCKEGFSPMLSALQFSFFSKDILFSFEQKNWNENGKYPNGVPV